MPFNWYSATTVRGYSAPEVVSALQKCVRRSDVEQAVYWAVELDRSNFGAHAWTRIRIMASEDVGMANPHLPATIRALHENWKDMRVRGTSHRLFLVNAVILLATSKKSRMVDHATCGHYGINERLYEIPDYALDMHTGRGRRQGRDLEHWYEDASLLVDPTGEVVDPTKDDPFWEINAMADRATEAPLQRTGRAPDVRDDEPVQEEIPI